MSSISHDSETLSSETTYENTVPHSQHSTTHNQHTATHNLLQEMITSVTIGYSSLIGLKCI